MLLRVGICVVGFLMAGPDELDGLVGSWGSVGWWTGVGGGRRKHFRFTQGAAWGIRLCSGRMSFPDLG